MTQDPSPPAPLVRPFIIDGITIYLIVPYKVGTSQADHQRCFENQVALICDEFEIDW